MSTLAERAEELLERSIKDCPGVMKEVDRWKEELRYIHSRRETSAFWSRQFFNSGCAMGRSWSDLEEIGMLIDGLDWNQLFNGIHSTHMQLYMQQTEQIITHLWQNRVVSGLAQQTLLRILSTTPIRLGTLLSDLDDYDDPMLAECYGKLVKLHIIDLEHIVEWLPQFDLSDCISEILPRYIQYLRDPAKRMLQDMYRYPCIISIDGEEELGCPIFLGLDDMPGTIRVDAYTQIVNLYSSAERERSKVVAARELAQRLPGRFKKSARSVLG